MLVTILLAFFLYAQTTAQHCSYVTVPVCTDDVTVSPGRLGGTKGDPGPPGKQGPRGIPGVKGNVGRRGPKGEVGNLRDFKLEIRGKLKEIEQLLTPASCLTSPVYGYQRLRNCQEAFCDNGWTVVQRRFNGSVDFNRNWQEYKEGFGNLTGEFWLGLDEMHRITSTQGCRLRIDLRGFDGTFAYAQYSSLVVEDESDNYRLHVDGYSGTAGDSFNMDHPHNGMAFTTKDRDNDRHPQNCAIIHNAPRGGWWHNSCFRATLNAPWGRISGSYNNMIWKSWKNMTPVKESTFKIRCD